MSVVEAGRWLAERLADAERAEAAWLVVLADFDVAQGWAVDGQLSCVEWLMWKGRMSRATAYEKLMVARQLRRRPILAEAFAAGRVSYSAVRLMARMDDPDPEVDRAMVDLAESGTVRDVERLVGLYRRHADQHRPPPELSPRRGLRAKAWGDGTVTVEITVTDLEAQDLVAAIEAFVDTAGHPHTGDGDIDHQPVDESARADSGVGAEAGTWWSKLADAVMDMARTAVAHIDAGPPGGADRHLVHLIRHGEQVRTLDGTPLHRATAERICCDTATVTHLFGPGWEPLAQGRKTKQWTTAQRRAARIRDGGTCRFPGCHRRIADLHHQQWWSQQGPTDITNGFLACDRHHTLLHHGYHTTGNPNHALTFHRPDGTAIGTTTPQLSRTLATV